MTNWFQLRLLQPLCVGVIASSMTASTVRAAETALRRPPLVIRAERLWDGTGPNVRRDTVVLIESDHISAVGSDVAIPAGAEVIESKGLTVIPGLIDLHVHFGAPTGPDLRKPPEELMKGYAAQRPDVRRALLEAGVTSIRSVGDVLGNPWWGIIGLSRMVESGLLEGPRVFAVGPIFTAPGGHPAGTIYKGNDFLIQNAVRQVDDPDAAREQVRQLAGLGVRGIKAVYDEGHEGGLPRLSLEVLRAIVDEAHKHGLWAAVHTSGNQEIRDAVEAGADTIEHGVGREPRIDPQTLELLRVHRVTYVPTLAVVESFVPEQHRKDAMRTRLGVVKAVFDAGAPLGAGTDAQGPNMAFGASLHRELALLVEAGLTPTQALQAATRNAAAALRMDKDLGTVEPGKLGDLVLVEGDPTQDIAAVAGIRLVIQGGRVVVDARKR